MSAQRHDGPEAGALSTERRTRVSRTPQAPHSPQAPYGPWVRSSYSTGMNNCVETARSGTELLAVRDSKDTAGPVLRFGSGVWGSFVSAVRRGQFGR